MIASGVTDTFVQWCGDRIRDREQDMYVGRHRSAVRSASLVSVPRHATEGRWLEATEALIDGLHVQGTGVQLAS